MVEESTTQEALVEKEATAFGGGLDLLLYATALGGNDPPDISGFDDAVDTNNEFIPRVDERVVIERYIEHADGNTKWFDTRTYIVSDIDQVTGNIRLWDEDAEGQAQSNFKTAPADRYKFKIPPKRGTAKAAEVKKSRKRKSSKRIAGSSVEWNEGKKPKVNKPRRVYEECGGVLVMYKSNRYFSNNTDVDITKGVIITGEKNAFTASIQEVNGPARETWRLLPTDEWKKLKAEFK